MIAHIIRGGIYMLLGLIVLWLRTIPRFRNRVWQEGLLLGVSVGFLFAGAEIAFPWFQKNADSLPVFLIIIGFALISIPIQMAADYLRKRSKAG